MECYLPNLKYDATLVYKLSNSNCQKRQNLPENHMQKLKRFVQKSIKFLTKLHEFHFNFIVIGTGNK